MGLQTKKRKWTSCTSTRHSFVKRALAARRKHDPGHAPTLHTTLPQLWREFKTGAEKATLTVEELGIWLRKAKGDHGSLGSESSATLQQALAGAARMPPLQQRLGVRFKDPSDAGTWGVDNLVGYSTKSVSSSGSRQSSEVTWSSYIVEFRLCSSGNSWEITRSSGTTALSAVVERCPRGSGPLVRGEMVTVTCLTRIREAEKSREKLKVERRRADLLPAVIYRSLQPSRVPQWTLIYLHGFSGSAFGDYANRPQYFLDGSIALKVVVPTAPLRELSIFDAWWLKVEARRPVGESSSSRPTAKKPRWRLNQFNAWFDYLTDSDGKREDKLDVESLHVMQRALHSLIRSEASELGGRFDRVMLAGKSQGCCTALDAVLTFPERLGGFIGVVGHLLSCTPVKADGPQVSTPLHFFHEVDDHMMNWAWVQQGVKKLKTAGYNVYSRRSKDPTGHGHYVEGGFEGRWIRHALQSICGSKK